MFFVVVVCLFYVIGIKLCFEHAFEVIKRVCRGINFDCLHSVIVTHNTQQHYASNAVISR